MSIVAEWICTTKFGIGFLHLQLVSFDLILFDCFEWGSYAQIAFKLAHSTSLCSFQVRSPLSKLSYHKYNSSSFGFSVLLQLGLPIAFDLKIRWSYSEQFTKSDLMLCRRPGDGAWRYWFYTATRRTRRRSGSTPSLATNRSLRTLSGLPLLLETAVQSRNSGPNSWFQAPNSRLRVQTIDAQGRHWVLDRVDNCLKLYATWYLTEACYTTAPGTEFFIISKIPVGQNLVIW